MLTDQPLSPFEKLARAKLLTLLQDLGGRTWESSASSLKLRNDAHRFFFSKACSGDFEAWCDTAGFHPDWVRSKARCIADNGLPKWRAEPGKGINFEKRKEYRNRMKAKNSGHR